MAKRKLGIAVIGIGGAVGTTMFAGVELIREGTIGTQGLPLAGEKNAKGYSQGGSNGERKKSNPDMFYGLGKYFTLSFFKKSI